MNKPIYFELIRLNELELHKIKILLLQKVKALKVSSLSHSYEHLRHDKIAEKLQGQSK